METTGGFPMVGILLEIHGTILIGIRGFTIPGVLPGVLIGDGTVGDGIVGVGEDTTILTGAVRFGGGLTVIP